MVGTFRKNTNGATEATRGFDFAFSLTGLSKQLITFLCGTTFPLFSFPAKARYAAVFPNVLPLEKVVQTSF